MTVRVYRSTDAGAPVLSGALGAAIALLDACLVNGYGGQTAAGWTKPYATGATVAAYQQGVGSNGRYMLVTDTTTVSATVRGYESMSSISVGLGPFPIIGQSPVYLQKSDAADSTARSWVLIATATLFHLIVNCYNQNEYVRSRQLINTFGDISSFRPGDTFNTINIGAPGTGGTTYFSTTSTDINATQPCHYIARSFTQLGGCISIGKFGNSIQQVLGAFPSIVDRQFICSPVAINESNGSVRGIIPGVWIISFSNTNNLLVDGQQYTFTSGTLNGITLEFHFIYDSVGFMFEVSNTW